MTGFSMVRWLDGRTALLGMLMTTTVLAVSGWMTFAHAQTEGAAGVQQQAGFTIAPQPLADALSRFGRQTGMQVSADAALLRGRTSPGVTGSMGPTQALSALLAGTGLTYRLIDGNTVVLEPVPEEDGAIRLGPVRIEGQQLGNTTEGTRSYTTGATNTAIGLNLTLKETPQSVTVVTRARMEDQATNEISEVLEQTIGIQYTPGAPLGTDGTSFYSRGFRVENFQVNGVARPTTIYGFEDTTTDTAIYDRIEVVRGATGLLNGVGTPAASINFVRKKPTRDFQAHISAQAGSWDRYRLEGDVSGSLNEDGTIRGRLVAAYQENDWFSDRHHVEKQVYFGTLEADLSEDLLLTVGAMYRKYRATGAGRGGVPLFFSDGTLSDFPRSVNTGAEWNDFYNSDLIVFSGLEYNIGGGWTANFDAEYSRPRYDDTMGYMWVSSSIGIDPVTGAGGSFLTSRWNGFLKQTSFDFRASGPYTLFGREHDLMVGASYSRSRDINDDFPGWWVTGDYRRPLDDFFAFYETGEEFKADLTPSGAKFGTIVKHSSGYTATRLRPINGVSVILGARISNWTEHDWNLGANDTSANAGPKTKEKGVFTPYGGVVVDVTENISAYVSYSEIFNPQTNEDINGDRLAPLTGENYEGGLKADFYDGRLNATVAVFHIKQDNFALSLGGILNPNGNTAYEAVSGTKSKGFEVEVTGEIVPGWQVSGGFSHTKVEDRNDSPLNTFVPKDTFKLFTSYDFSGALDDLLIGGNVRWQGRSYNENLGPNGETFEQDGFVLVDLMARYTVTEDLSLALNVNNLFDKTYYSGHGSTGIYGTPRHAIVTAKYTF